jgi:NAD-dependent deacetylase
MDAVQQFGELISAARAGVAFTGAGISTESGLSDFRSAGGVWSRHKMVMYDEFLASREARVRYWKMRMELYPEFAKAKPNDGHLAIAKLEELGKIVAVVTQNIDGLHQDAGSSRVIELHGTARRVVCVGCGKESPPEEVVARFEAGDDAPNCEECGQPLKSATVSFGQAMLEDAMAESAQLSQQADLYLAIGSSLVVEPAASLPRLAKQCGATLVILNKTETPLDDSADLIIREPIGETMRAVLRQIGAPQD